MVCDDVENIHLMLSFVHFYKFRIVFFLSHKYLVYEYLILYNLVLYVMHYIKVNMLNRLARLTQSVVNDLILHMIEVELNKLKQTLLKY